jgi:uncharacterized protein YlxW (UPF0749 family)
LEKEILVKRVQELEKKNSALQQKRDEIQIKLTEMKEAKASMEKEFEKLKTTVCDHTILALIRRNNAYKNSSFHISLI